MLREALIEMRLWGQRSNAAERRSAARIAGRHISIFHDRWQLAFSGKAMVNLVSSADPRRHIPGVIGVAQAGKMRLIIN